MRRRRRAGTPPSVEIARPSARNEWPHSRRTQGSSPAPRAHPVCEAPFPRERPSQGLRWPARIAQPSRIARPRLRARSRASSSTRQLGANPLEDLLGWASFRLSSKHTGSAAPNLLAPESRELFHGLLRCDRVDHDAALVVRQLGRKSDDLINRRHAGSMLSSWRHVEIGCYSRGGTFFIVPLSGSPLGRAKRSVCGAVCAIGSYDYTSN